LHDLFELLDGYVVFAVFDVSLGVFQLPAGLPLKLVGIVLGFVGRRFFDGRPGLRLFGGWFFLDLFFRGGFFARVFLFGIASFLALDDEHPAVVSVVVCLVFFG